LYRELFLVKYCVGTLSVTSFLEIDRRRGVVEADAVEIEEFDQERTAVCRGRPAFVPRMCLYITIH